MCTTKLFVEVPLKTPCAHALFWQVSNIPFSGPVAGVRVGWLAAAGPAAEGSPILAPRADEESHSTLDLLLSSTDNRVLMMELAGDEVPETSLIRCLRFAHEAARVCDQFTNHLRLVYDCSLDLQPLLALQHELRAKCGRPKRAVPLFVPPPAVINAVRGLIYEDARRMYGQHHFKKPQRGYAQRLLHVKV